MAGAGDRGWGLLATLVGMRVTVALGSRLRGNDEGEARGRRIMHRSPDAGTTGGGVGAAGAGDREWGCAGFPPSRERRGGGAWTTNYASVSGRGNDRRGRGSGGGGRPGVGLRWVPAFAGTTRGKRGDDELCRGLRTRERQEGRGSGGGGPPGVGLRWVPPSRERRRGKRGNDELCIGLPTRQRRERAWEWRGRATEGGGCWRPWLVCE